MSNWWDKGIKGKDNNIIYSVYNGFIGGYHDITYYGGNTIALTSGENGSTYSKLLLTTESGTQIYLEVKRELTTAELYRPTETKNVWWFPCRFYLRKNGQNYYYDNTWHYSLGLTYLDNIYLYYDRVYPQDPVEYDNGNFVYKMQPFPYNGSQAMNNATIGYTSDNSGIHIYVVGFNCTYWSTHFTGCPSNRVLTIPSAVLNNTDYFSPLDGASDNDVAEEQSKHRRSTNNYKGEDIGFPSLPTGASALGLSTMSMYNPSASQLSNALDILYTDSEESTLEQIIETCKKWWYKPQQYCVSCMLTPVPVSTSTSKNIYFGKYNTQVSAPTVTNQWQIVDCGTLSVPLMYGNYLDFTKVQAMIFLPYIGFRNINVQEIMGGTIAIKYYIDIYTGSGVCFIKCSNQGCNNSVLYSYECNVNTQVPITSNDYTTIVTNLIKASVSVASTVATGGMTAPIGASLLTGSTLTSAQTMSAPPIQTSGCLTPNTGVLGNAKPYIVLHFPVSVIDSEYISMYGMRSDYTTNVGSLTGFNSFKEIHLDNIALPSEVLKEVESQFKQGVII